jgi:diguanylate cyclase (GGDEF)-like protein
MANIPHLVFYKYSKSDEFIRLLGDDFVYDKVTSLKRVNQLYENDPNVALVVKCSDSEAIFKWLPENRDIPAFLILEKNSIYSAKNIIDWIHPEMSTDELLLRILRGLNRFNDMKKLQNISNKAIKDRDIQLKMNDRLIKISQDLKAAKEKIEELSLTDSLTKLKNRRFFDFQLERELLQSSRYGNPLSTFILDLDNFKHINDTYGHQQGDLVLANLANIINSSLRDTDWAARYGGEEFFIVLPMTDLDGALKTADRIRERIEAELSHIDNLIMTTSIGAAEFDADHMDSGSLIEVVDKALYESKHTGKNKVTYYSKKKKEYCESSSGKNQPSYR